MRKYRGGRVLDYLKSTGFCASIPLSYKDGPNEIAFIYNSSNFVNILTKAYPSLEREVVGYLKSSREPILFLPIAGYVMDSGGPAFSRPDKGLVGLMRVVFANKRQFSRRLALLYSPLVPRTWKEQLLEAKKENQSKFSTRTNNLWREVVRFATCIILDRWSSGLVL